MLRGSSVELDRAREAVRLLGAADATRERLTTRHPPLHEREVEESTSKSRAMLTLQEWDEAYQAGRGMLIQDCLVAGLD